MTTRLWIHFWAALILLIPLGAQAVQDGAINDAGDIAFVAYHDNDDGFSFVLMDDAPHNTSIRFVDEEWTGAAFNSLTSEGDVLWTNTTGSTIAKGTVVDIVDADDNLGGIAPSVGTAVETDLGFGTANGDQIYAITGTRAAPGTFLAFVGESQDINGAETAVLTSTGLTAGTNAKLIDSEGYYNGSTSCFSDLTTCLQQINNAVWIGSAGFSYPSVIPDSFSGTIFGTDATPPVVNSITLSGSPASSATSVIFAVGFDENANNISTDDFSVTTVSGSASGSVASVSAASGSSITVTVNSITGVGSIRLDLKASTNIIDDTGNGNGTNGSVAAFSTGGTHTVAILDSDGSLTASATVTEPVAINTTVDTGGEAINVFDFTLTDGGTTDGQAMTVSQVVVNVSGTSSDTNRANVTWRLNGNDASNVSGVYNAGGDTITFSGLSISIANNTSEVYTVNAFYNDNTGLTEGLTYILSVDGDTDLTIGGSGTQMGSTSAVTNVTGSTVDVVATTVDFTTNPAGLVSGIATTTQPVVAAKDAFGNIDKDFTENVTIIYTPPVSMTPGSVTGNVVAAVNGVATFTHFAFTASQDGQGVIVQANDVDGTGSNLLTDNSGLLFVDVVATVLEFSTQPAGSVSGNALTTQPVVEARDANGVTDTDFTETITLTEGSAGSIINNTVAASAGVATFSGLAYTATADQQSFTLTANDQDGIGTNIATTNASAVTSDVVATQLVFDTQPVPLTVTSGTATSFTTVPVVSAKDANNVVDTGYSTTVVIGEINGAGSALMSGTGDTDGDSATVSLTPISGVATFTAMQAAYTLSGASNENFNLAASASGLTTATSSQLTAMLPVPTITSSTYNATTASLVVTGTEFEANASGADVDVSKLTITGEGGATYALTTADVERDNATQFTVNLNTADKLNVNGLLNKTGTTADIGTTYNIAAADDFITNVTGGDTADASGNGITVSNVVIPTITSAIFNGSGTILTVTGTGFVKKPGANNDVDVSKITVSGETYTANSISLITYTSPYTVTSTSDVEITSATQFTVTLPETGFSGVLTANGLKASDDATYNVAFADDWMPGAATNSNIEDLTGNGLTVSNALTYSITASSNATTNGGSDGSATATAIGGTAGFNYAWSDGQNTATAGSWVAGTYKTSVTDANGLVRTASVTITEPSPDPIITSAAYNGSTGVLTVTGSNFVTNSGADNDVDISLLTIVGQAGNTRSLTTAADVEITNSSTFTVTLSSAEKNAVDFLLNKVGTAADDTTTYNLAAAEDWMPGALVASNIADLSNNAITVSNPADTISPRVISVSSSSGIASNIVGDYIPVVITFSENVVITGTPQIELETGATDRIVDRVGPFSGISELKFDYQVQVGDISADLAYKAINSLTLNGGTIKDSAGNNAVLTLPVPGAAGSLSANKNHVVDGIVPTVVISGVPTNTNTAFTATFTFSESVTGFDATDITLGNATKGTFTATSATVYTLVVTPTGAAVTVDIAANGAVDASGNGNPAASQATANYDATDPTVVISGVAANSNAAFTATFTFNEAVTGFDATDITLGNATKSTFTATSATVYTLVVTPTGAAVTVDVAANGAIDVANNGNTAATQASSAFDNMAPRISDIFRAIPASSPTNVDSLTWTIAFNEIVNNLDVTDFQVTGPTATAKSINKIGESVYRVTASGGDLASFNGTATLSIASGHSLTDEAGNALTNLVPTVQNVNTFVVDNSAPTLVISGIPANSNEAFTATFTFNEAVTGFDATDITLGNATKGTFTATSSTVYTLVATPTGAAVTIDVAANGATDTSGNGNTAAIQATSNYDTTDPTVVISGVPENSNAAFTATFTFNEAVTGFDATDIALVNATKGTFTATSSTVYTLVITPTGAAVTVDVAENGAIDVASNGNTAATQASSAFDNDAPTLTIAAPSVTTTRNGPVTYALSYANADNITLALSNITLNKTGDADGTLALSGTGNSRTVTISDISGDGTLAISIAANSASDNAGNNAAAANSASITVVSNQTGTLSISGNTVVGETLTANVADTDGLTDITIAYQWTSGGSNVGTSVGSYTLQASDVGKTISVNAQYTDQRGAAENLTSAATSVIITTQSDAVNRISSTANQAGGTEPTVDDYKTAGVTDVSDVVLTRILPLINSAIARQSDATDVDDVTKLQALVNVILEGQDNDEDGLPNLVEGTGDTDNDGTTDREDTDSDNDGVADKLEVRLTLTDSDSDGIIDVLDADVGNDGQVDTGKVDANFDGVDDALDSMAELIAKAVADTQAASSSNGEIDLPFKQFNQDQDQRPNHLDLDTDNDGIMDVVESGLSDTDGDGKLDTGDTLITDGSKLLDGDVDTLPNMLELKSDGISFDLSVNGLPDTLDKDANGILDSTIDMDRDGIIDSVDNAVGAQGTLPDVDKDGIPNHLDEDDDGDGIPDVNENPQQQHFTGQDADADGIDDGVDQNINGVLAGEDLNENGIRDDRELSDVDNDGIADHMDADSDNDGIPDSQDIVVNVGDDVKSGGAGTMNIMMMLSLLLLSVCRYSRSVLRTAVVLLLWLSATISHAQDWQVNLGFGQSNLTPDLANGLETSDGNDRAVQLGLGYRISSDWLVELRYSDLGEAIIRGNQRHSTLGYQSWALDTKYQLPFLRGTGWLPYVMGGMAINRLQADDLSLEKKTDSGLMLGTGISYRFQEFQVNSELIRYSDDISGWFMGIQKDF